MLVLHIMGICLVASYIMFGVEAAATTSVRITTTPRKGPFRIGQTVVFTCQVEPALAVPIIYHWRIVDGADLSFYTFRKSFIRRYAANTLRYCWYFCSAGSNGRVLGSADKLVEVHDVDECKNVSLNNCSTSLHEECINTQGSFECNCPSGYGRQSRHLACTDIDECSNNIHDCDVLATCYNTGGSFGCRCNDGYTGNGIAGNCEGQVTSIIYGVFFFVLLLLCGVLVGVGALLCWKKNRSRTQPPTSLCLKDSPMQHQNKIDNIYE